MARVNLFDINLAFDDPTILENVNFQIDPGERVCQVGRNGSGKTMLMRVIRRSAGCQACRPKTAIRFPKKTTRPASK